MEAGGASGRRGAWKRVWGWGVVEKRREEEREWRVVVRGGGRRAMAVVMVRLDGYVELIVCLVRGRACRA